MIFKKTFSASYLGIKRWEIAHPLPKLAKTTTAKTKLLADLGLDHSF